MEAFADTNRLGSLLLLGGSLFLKHQYLMANKIKFKIQLDSKFDMRLIRTPTMNYDR